jgi:predicted RNA binding protein with dsRBD fold (UPF0201 family)
MNIDSKRIYEAELLVGIAKRAAMLNHSSGIVERIQLIEDLYIKIGTDDMKSPRQSFINWLIPFLQQALRDQDEIPTP